MDLKQPQSAASSPFPLEKRLGGTAKIGLILPSTPGYSETFFTNKIKGLQANGIEVILFVSNTAKTSDICRVCKAPVLNGNKILVVSNSLKILLKAVFIHPKRSLKFYRLERQDKQHFVKIVKQLIANQFILSESLDWLHFGYGTMALGSENVAQAINANMAVSFRGFDFYIYPIKHENCYTKLFSKPVKYHVLSEQMKMDLIKKGIDPDKISKISPAIDLKFFSEHAHQNENDSLQIATIARLHWKKGLEYTLEALALLKKANIDFHYTLIGEGIEKERLQFAVYQLGLTEQVTFAGQLPPDAVKRQLQQTDIYIQYSIQEGFCNAVLEAQSMGLLCIVSNAEGLDENVLDNVTGWVVPKRHPKLLAEKIQQVLALDSQQKQTISQNAQKRVNDEFSIEKQQEAFLGFYKL